MKAKIKKIGLILAAGACAFIIYMIWFLVISLMHDYLYDKGMQELKLFSGSFLKPIGLMLIATWLILSGMFLKHRKARKLGTYILILYVIVSVVPYGLSFFVEPSGSVSEAVNGGSDTPKIVVSDSVQPSGGLTEIDMNREFLSNYSDFVKEGIINGLRQNLESKNKYLPGDFDMPSESMYINSGGKKLAVVRFTFYGGASSVEILGINGNQLHRVSCNHQSPKNVPLVQGECADRISEVFGINFEKGMQVEHL